MFFHFPFYFNYLAVPWNLVFPQGHGLGWPPPPVLLSCPPYQSGCRLNNKYSQLLAHSQPDICHYVRCKYMEISKYSWPYIRNTKLYAISRTIFWVYCINVCLVLTHRWSSQCLSSNQLGGAETIQEVTELGIRGKPHTREDETETD